MGTDASVPLFGWVSVHEIVKETTGCRGEWTVPLETLSRLSAMEGMPAGSSSHNVAK